MQLKETFNTVANNYDKWRPTYVKDLYETILSKISLNEESKILEIGIGTGHATLPFLKLGCQVTAIELGDSLAAFVSNKFADYDNFKVLNMPFEEFEDLENTYDLIYSATAFHWIDEALGYQKVHALLKDGGVFARFANRPYKDKTNDALDKDIRQVYAKCLNNNEFRGEFDDDACRQIAEIPLKYGFDNISYYLYKRTREFTGQGYASLLATYSHTIDLEDNIRIDFLNNITETIRSHGNRITVFDTIDLQLAFK